MIEFKIQIHEAEHGGVITTPEGCDGFPHMEQVLFVPGRGFVLFSMWRVTPPPIPATPPRKPVKAKPAK